MISLMIRTMVFGVPVPAIRWMIRILTVIATRMISVKYAVRNGITLKAPRPAAISMAMERRILIAFIKTPPQIGVDRIQMTGNALENLKDAYPDCRFVDFSYPELDPAYQGLDWCSLRLVFAPETTKWRLVGIVHGQWTI